MLWVTINRPRRAASPSLSLGNSHATAWRHPEGERTSGVKGVTAKGVKAAENGDCSHLPTVNSLQGWRRTFHLVPVAGGRREGLSRVWGGAYPQLSHVFFHNITIIWWKELIGRCQVKHFRKIKKATGKQGCVTFWKIRWSMFTINKPTSTSHIHMHYGSPLTLSISLIKKKI